MRQPSSTTHERVVAMPLLQESPVNESIKPARGGHRESRRAARRARRAARRHSRVENLFLGTALAAFGIVAWGFQQEREWAAELLGWWPLLLAWIGLGKLLSGRYAGGIALFTGGGLAFLHLQGLADFEYTWPLILVAVGVAITLGALVGQGGPFADESEQAATPGESSLDESSFDDHNEEANRG